MDAETRRLLHAIRYEIASKVDGTVAADWFIDPETNSKRVSASVVARANGVNRKRDLTSVLARYAAPLCAVHGSPVDPSRLTPKQASLVAQILRSSIEVERRHQADELRASSSWLPPVRLRDAGLCRYCGKFARDHTLDHVVPRSKGGSSDYRNLALACRSCNSRKGARTPAEAGMVLLEPATVTQARAVLAACTQAKVPVPLGQAISTARIALKALKDGAPNALLLCVSALGECISAIETLRAAEDARQA